MVYLLDLDLTFHKQAHWPGRASRALLPTVHRNRQILACASSVVGLESNGRGEKTAEHNVPGPGRTAVHELGEEQKATRCSEWYKDHPRVDEIGCIVNPQTTTRLQTTLAGRSLMFNIHWDTYHREMGKGYKENQNSYRPRNITSGKVETYFLVAKPPVRHYS